MTPKRCHFICIQIVGHLPIEAELVAHDTGQRLRCTWVGPFGGNMAHRAPAAILCRHLEAAIGPLTQPNRVRSRHRDRSRILVNDPWGENTLRIETYLRNVRPPLIATREVKLHVPHHGCLHGHDHCAVL